MVGAGTSGVGLDARGDAWRWTVSNLWGGGSLPPDQRAVLELRAVDDGDSGELTLHIDAPFHGDASPTVPAGRCAGLWNHEVVELFLLGDDARYLEIECGPHGHYLVLSLHGVRAVVDDARAPTSYTAAVTGARWQGALRFPRAWIPAGWRRANAYAIWGVGASRRYAGAVVGDGPPDFHRLDLFPPLEPLADARTTAT